MKEEYTGNKAKINVSGEAGVGFMGVNIHGQMNVRGHTETEKLSTTTDINLDVICRYIKVEICSAQSVLFIYIHVIPTT